MEYVGPERRRYPRIPISLPVNYSVVSNSEVELQSDTEDISGGGMRLPVKEEFGIGALLKEKLELLRKQKDISLQARVVWITPVQNDRANPFRAGLEFINIELSESALINNCLLYRINSLREAFR